MELQKITDASLPYLLSVPPGAKPGAKLPLVIFLHGRNVCAEPNGDKAKSLDLLLDDGVPALLAGNGGTTTEFDAGSSFPNPVAVNLLRQVVTISPQMRYDDKVPRDQARWAVGALKTFVGEVLKRHADVIDTSRVYLTGLSMGGGGTWSLALAEPDLFAAILPLCAGGNAARAAALKSLPIWCHAATDDVLVPIKAVDGLMDELKKINVHVGYSRLPGFPHQCALIGRRLPNAL
ncbi:Alpha/Beta hydrolase protein [Hyaloraphidium curvatum]|nr:Alpha/Beta hydrolase protein [Hyaloraphidium curvatum]